jgi:hypothetical protein
MCSAWRRRASGIRCRCGWTNPPMPRRVFINRCPKCGLLDAAREAVSLLLAQRLDCHLTYVIRRAVPSRRVSRCVKDEPGDTGERLIMSRLSRAAGRLRRIRRT